MLEITCFINRVNPYLLLIGEYNLNTNNLWEAAREKTILQIKTSLRPMLNNYISKHVK